MGAPLTQAGPSPPDPCSVPRGTWEIQDGRNSRLPAWGAHLGWGTWWEWESPALFFTRSTQPTHPPTTCCPQKWENIVCSASVVLGDASVAAAGDHSAGDTKFLLRRAPPAGQGCRASRTGGAELWLDTSAIWQARPLKLPHTLLLFIPSVVRGAHYSWARNIQRLPIADRIQTSQTVISCASQPRPTPASQPHLPPLKSHRTLPSPRRVLPFPYCYLPLPFLLSCSLLSLFAGWRVSHRLLEAFLDHPTPRRSPSPPQASSWWIAAPAATWKLLLGSSRVRS